MSLKAMTWAFEQDLKPDLKIVLLALADYADGDGICFPGQKSIAAKVSMSERTVRAKLAELEERGYIERRRRQSADGYRSTDEYRLLPAGSAAWPTGKHAEGYRQTVAATQEPSEPPVNNSNARATQWPRDLTWNQGHKDKALGKGVNVEVEFEKFRDYHLARGSKFADWSRAFHYWLNNARPEPRGGQLAGNPRPAPKTPTDRMNEVLAIRDPRENGLTS